MIREAEPFALSRIIVCEILQGLTRTITRIEHYLLQWEMHEPRGFKTYCEAAAIHRAARAKGVYPHHHRHRHHSHTSPV